MTSRKFIFRNISLIPLLLFSNLLLSTIVVDGKLDEEEWKSAQKITKFYQVMPFTLAEPEQTTIVLVHETEKGLFVGYKNYQPTETMRAQQHERDADDANADHGEAHDATARKRYPQGWIQPRARCCRRAHVGLHGDAHAGDAGQA